MSWITTEDMSTKHRERKTERDAVDEGVGSYDGLDVVGRKVGRALGDDDGAMLMLGTTDGTSLGIPLGAPEYLHSALQAQGHLAMSSATSSSSCKERIAGQRNGRHAG
jgi:hypothetical protein